MTYLRSEWKVAWNSEDCFKLAPLPMNPGKACVWVRIIGESEVDCMAEIGAMRGYRY